MKAYTLEIKNRRVWMTSRYDAEVAQRKDGGEIIKHDLPVNLKDWIVWLNEREGSREEPQPLEEQTGEKSSEIVYYEDTIEKQKKVIEHLQAIVTRLAREKSK